MFGSINTNDKAMEEKSDRIGGGFQPLASGIYPATVTYAYGTTSKGGAMGLVVKFAVQVEEGAEPRPFTQTFWVTDKKGNTFYVDQQGNPHNLMGFNQANHLVALITGKTLKEVDAEEVVIPLYNVEQKKEVPTTVNALTELHDAEIAIAIKHIRTNKQEKSPTTGEYEPVNEERFINEIDKIFKIKDGNAFTFEEVRDELEPAFAEAWLNRWEGKTDDKFKEVKGAGTAKAGTTRKLNIG